MRYFSCSNPKSLLCRIAVTICVSVALAQPAQAEALRYCRKGENREPTILPFLQDTDVDKLFPRGESDAHRYCVAAQRWNRIKDAFVVIITRRHLNLLVIVKPSADGQRVEVIGKSALPKTFACTDVSSEGIGYEKDFSFDFAPYRMTDDLVAFGFRCSGGEHTYAAGGTSRDTVLNLFALFGTAIKPIVSLIVKISGEAAGEWQPDGSRPKEAYEHKFTIQVLKTKTKGYFDWQTSTGLILQWNGERYVRKGDHDWEIRDSALLQWNGEKYACDGDSFSCIPYQ